MISKSAKIYSKNLHKSVEIKDFSIIYEHVTICENVHIGENVIIGRVPAPTKAMIRNINKEGNVYIGENCSISANVIIYNNISINKNTLIGDNVSIFSNVNIGESVLISRNVTINSDVEIGDNTRIMDNSHITGRTKIGKNVFISVGVTMANDNLFGKNGYDDEVKGPKINDYVSIGVGAILLPNIEIGEGSIVAAGSVVNKNVPENVIVSGNPAKVITRVPKYMRRK